MNTSWESSSSWYDKIVGSEGHYYHQQVILPRLLQLMLLKKGHSLLDLACGQGVLSLQIPKDVPYLGIDASSSLIQAARKRARSPEHLFEIADLSTPLALKHPPFSHATCILAAQNIENLDALIGNAASHLQPGGRFYCVINHPCFRIPRQSHWAIDEKKKLQYRRVDRYMTPLSIPIQTHPGSKEDSPTTFSFHRPLSAYSAAFLAKGFTIVNLEEWTSDKLSIGKNAPMENRCRQEFPLFLTWIAEKKC